MRNQARTSTARANLGLTSTSFLCSISESCGAALTMSAPEVLATFPAVQCICILLAGSNDSRSIVLEVGTGQNLTMLLLVTAGSLVFPGKPCLCILTGQLPAILEALTSSAEFWSVNLSSKPFVSRNGLRGESTACQARGIHRPLSNMDSRERQQMNSKARS